MAPGQREALVRLGQFLDRTKRELEELLEQADAIHRPGPEVEAREQRDRDRAAQEHEQEQREADSDAAPESRFREIEAVLLDVSVHNINGSARVDLRVRVSDGSERVVHMTRGGVKLITGGRQGRLQDLREDQVVVLVVQRATGEVVEVHVKRPTPGRTRSSSSPDLPIVTFASY